MEKGTRVALWIGAIAVVTIFTFAVVQDMQNGGKSMSGYTTSNKECSQCSCTKVWQVLANNEKEVSCKIDTGSEYSCPKLCSCELIPFIGWEPWLWGSDVCKGIIGEVPSQGVKDSCGISGNLGKRCEGSCPKGQECKLVTDGRVCGCV